MTREIKFRAWHKVPEKMEECYSIPLPNTTMDESDNRAVIYMQYTGLKDRHGKEIYEGDIVKHASFSENGKHEMTVVVGADDCKFIDIGFLCEDDMQTGQSPINEIIGNIYENPELLPNNN